MIELVDQLTGIVSGWEVREWALATVFTGVLLRVLLGDVVFASRYAKVWNIIRRVAAPIVEKTILNNIAATAFNRVPKREGVARVTATPLVVIKQFESVGSFEVPLLAGFKSNWNNQTEQATVVSYHGSKAFPGCPEWLRSRQLHITLFTNDSGQTVITAHEEANSYRPDLWATHLYAKGQSAEKGREMTRELLEETALADNMTEISP